MLVAGTSPLQRLHSLPGVAKTLEVYLKRDDLLHTQVSGNKWRKLKFYLQNHDKKRPIVSFGGAFSNHLHALAYAASAYGIECHAIVRGEEHAASNPTLSDCRRLGMQLHFVSRKTYQQRHHKTYCVELSERFGGAVILPEGGMSEWALKGVAEIYNEISSLDCSHLICPVGSATTLAGLVLGRSQGAQIFGVAALKNANYLIEQVEQASGVKYGQNWHMILDAHQGGFARINPELLAFVKLFWQRYQILLDPIYTAKMMMAFCTQIAPNLAPSDRVVLVHTGGLQGWQGFINRGMLSAAYQAEIGLQTAG